jgi:site-specific DNA-methyltransferase (adenine-specific)
MTKKLLGSLELNRIYQRECIEGMALIPDKSIDMILCDLPYGTTRNKWDSVIDLTELWAQYERLIKDNGAIVLTAQTPFDKVLGASNLKLLKYEWIWQKDQGTGHLNAKKMPLKNHENILVFYKNLPTYNPQMVGDDIRKVRRSGNDSKTTNYGKFVEISESTYQGRYPVSIQGFSRDKEKHHPTQKPVDLFTYLIRTYTTNGDIVLDNCMGSGTTAIAAAKTGRNFIGFELEPEYVKIANQRLEALRDEAAEQKLTE